MKLHLQLLSNAEGPFARPFVHIAWQGAFCSDLTAWSLLQHQKFVYVYSNSEMAATISEAGKLKMFAWDNEDV